MSRKAQQQESVRARLKVTGHEPENVYFRSVRSMAVTLERSGGPEAADKYLEQQEAALREAFTLVREHCGIDRRPDVT